MKSWKKHFTGTILDRGLDYYDSNAVRIYDYSPDFIDAQVAGTNIYELRINFKDSDIASMYCNCPYEGNCKHLAATLYYIDNHPELLEKREDISDLISSSSHAELAEFLSEELKNNLELSNKFKLFKNQGIDNEFYKNKLKYSFSDSINVLKFIDDDLEMLKDARQIDLVLDLSESIVNHAEEIALNGEYDRSDEIIVRLYDLLYAMGNSGFENQVCDFLEYFILNSDDELVLELFTDVYSRFKSVEELFDKHFTKS